MWPKCFHEAIDGAFENFAGTVLFFIDNSLYFLKVPAPYKAFFPVFCPHMAVSCEEKI